MLEEIIVNLEPGQLRLKLHWKGGDHTTLEVVKNRRGQHRWKTDMATEQLICDLARLLPDNNIASVLNRLGVRTAKATRGLNSACEHSAVTMALRFTAKVNAWNAVNSFWMKQRVVRG